MISRLIVSLLLHTILPSLASQSTSSEVQITVKGIPVTVTLIKTEYSNRTLLLTLVNNGTSSDKITIQITACLCSAHEKEKSSDCRNGRLEYWFLDNKNKRVSLQLAGDFDAVGCQAIIGQIELKSDGSSRSIDFELLNPTFSMIITKSLIAACF